MQPTDITAVNRPDLGAIAYEYMLEADQRGFIALLLLPIFEVMQQSAQYPIIPLESLLKLEETSRAARGKYNRSDYKFDFGNYSCKENGWEEVVDDREAALYARYFDAEEVATKRAIDIILRGQEARVAAKVFNVSNITATADVSIAWNTPSTAVPRANIYAAKMALRAATGIEPNIGACSKKVFDTVMLTAEIRDALKYTNPIEIGGYEAQRRILAQYFGLDNILVGGAMKDSADKGIAASLADIWDDEYFGLFRVSTGGPDLREPCLGRTFLWTGQSPQNIVTESYRDETVRGTVIRVRQDTDEAFVFTGAGYLLGNIIHP
jgi:hypothetical protein